ncbi:MAG: leucine-rich repeat domain-containing protein, partial [Muribaculaceae bacterium]|nr:leucine-rich repeat domain-containing protein [Muribaculaceae bacterium]
MKKYINRLRRVSAALALIAGFVSASALEVKVDQPGSLEKAVGDQVSATTLKVNGPVDARDLYFIGRSMTALTELDLGEAEIAEYIGKPLEGAPVHSASCFPTAVFGGLGLDRIVLPSKGDLVIGPGAFAGTRFSELVLPENIIRIGDGAFAGCGELKSVKVPKCILGVNIF